MAGQAAGRSRPSTGGGGTGEPVGRRQSGRSFRLAGGAAGIAAAFNTPLAGIVFAIEELGKRFEEKTNGVLISAIVLAGLISISFQGNYTYFGRLAVASVDYRILWPVIIASIVCGVCGGPVRARIR